MSEREAYDAQQDAMREAAGKNSPQTRERIWQGLTKYLSAEAGHARKVARAEQEESKRRRS